jgi:hypothetical protein
VTLVATSNPRAQLVQNGLAAIPLHIEFGQECLLLKFWLLRLCADKQRAFAQGLWIRRNRWASSATMSGCGWLRLGMQQLVQCLQFWVVNAVGHLRFMLAFPREH